MRIVTCNVNGIRAAHRKGMSEWLAGAQPDVLLLQEVRAPEELVGGLIGPGYQVFNRACDIKGRAGVTVAVREGIDVGEVRDGVAAPYGAEEPPVDTGRWLEVVLPGHNLTVVSAYLHSGVATDPAKMEAKYAHLDAVTRRLEDLREPASAGTAHVVVAGDFNIVHTERDIKNWKSNHNKTAGVLDPEIAYLDRWLGDMGFVDTARRLEGDVDGPYTWWSQRGRAFENNVGWRIDYQMATPELAAAATTHRVDRAASYEARFSDHAPVVIEYEV